MRGSPRCPDHRSTPVRFYLPFSTLYPLVRSVSDEFFKDRHLHVQPVLRLVEYGGLGSLDHLVLDLLAPVGGEAVHHDGMRRRLAKQRRVDAISPECGKASPPLGFLPHARPDVRIEDIRAARR